jgi:cyclohexadienyl dehydratase
MVTDGADVDYQARRHPGVLCPAAVADSFDHFDKAYWMTRDSVLKNAVDAWLEKALKAGNYQKALAAAADDNR